MNTNLENYIKILLKEKFEEINPNAIYISENGKLSYYLSKLNDNLYVPMNEDILKQYNDGNGNEISSKKMNAIHSSSALSYNIFHDNSCMLKNNNYNLSDGIYKVTFEKKFPVLKTPANIDVILDKCNSTEYIAIEMKMLEWLRKKSNLSDSYLDENKYLDLKSGKIFAEIAKKLKQLSLHYDADQLFRHSVGLYKACKIGLINNKNKITLMNCVWTVVNHNKLTEPFKTEYCAKENNLFNEFKEFKKIMTPVFDLFKEINIEFDICIFTVSELINILFKTEDEIMYLQRYIIN